MSDRPAGSVSIDVAGLWALWRILEVRSGERRVESTVDRLRELGIPRSVAYRRLGEFRAVTGKRWPSQITGEQLGDLLRARQQQQLPIGAP